MASFDANCKHTCGHMHLYATLVRLQNMSPFSSCNSVLPGRETNEASQIAPIHKMNRGNPGRFDMVESFEAEI